MNEDKIVEYLARMFAIVIVGLIVATMLTLCSCTRTIYVPQVSVERDSIYLHTHTRDSIWIHDSVTIKEKGDTVWLTRWRTEYRDRILIDTAYIERTDTIMVPYPVEKKVSWWESTMIVLRSIPTMFVITLAIVLPLYFLMRRKE